MKQQLASVNWHRMISARIRSTLVLLSALFTVTSSHAQSGKKPEPTHKEVRYGPHERNVLDFWKADSTKPTPFVIHIHGGGFAIGSKEGFRDTTLKELLDAGISVVSVNYRYYQQAPLPAALHDCRRALQFVRSKAAEWTLDKSRAGAFGGSAGAITSMYLAFHDEMANPASNDPVERESTRLTCVATTAGQTTLDTDWWANNVPGWSKTEGVKDDVHAYRRWGCSEADFPALIADGSALHLISKDDAPIWMSYGMRPDDAVPTEPKAALYWKIHHVAFGVALKKQMDALGLESHLAYRDSKESQYTGLEKFFHAKLQVAAVKSAELRPAAASPILEQAARGIEAHRKGDATIRFVRKDGAPVSGLKVEVIQRTHDFAFGNLFRPRHYTNEQYRARFLELFNFIQLLEFNWGQYEREEGKPELAERREFINGWCRTNGLTRFYGHMLTWSYQVDEPRDIGPVNPFWLFRYDGDTQFRLLRQRIEREVRAYRDVDIIWDVVNEPIHCRRWGDWNKRNDVDEPIADVLPYVRDALNWAHEANPNARLLINDYRIIPANKYRDRYRELVAMLKKEKVPLHAIGIQAHSPGNGAHWFSPEEIWQTCELFSREPGFPICFTEFWQVSDPQRKISGAHAPGNWSLELQADAIEQFYRVAFGHPAVQAIIYFGMIDGETESPTLGLLDANFQPKPAWTRLKKLIKEEWTTRQSGATDAAGSYVLRGFFGQYDVRATDAGKEQTFTAHLQKGQPNEWQFVLK